MFSTQRDLRKKEVTMESNERESLHEDSAKYVRIASISGLGLTALFIYLSGAGHQELVIDLVGGVVVAVFVLQIGELWRHRNLSPKLASLERAVGHSRLFKLIESIIDKYEAIEDQKLRNPNCSRFFEEFSSEAFQNLEDELQSLSTGQINVRSESRELTTNQEFLLSLPRRLVKAVSFQDEEFWEQPQGKTFLDAHRLAVSNKISIERIFILKKSVVESQRVVITKQMEMGIDCRIVIQESLKEEDLEDFVVYDDEYVRYAKLVQDTGSNTLKRATLSAQSDTVRRYVQKFEALEVRSVRALECFGTTDPSAETSETGQGD